MNTLYQKRKKELQNFFENNKRLPSYSEMLTLFNLKSKNSVHFLVEKFIKDGILEKDIKGKLIPKNLNLKTKILGTVEAGFPSPAEEELADSITIDRYLISNKEATFLLKVSGESMIGDGIFPGDLVLIEKGRQVFEGDIVIAEVDSEWTIKRYTKQGGQVILLPSNPRFKPIIPKECLNIAGVVTAVVRKYH